MTRRAAEVQAGRRVLQGCLVLLVAATILCLGAAFRSEWSGLSRLGLALAAGGGISNLADRVRYGAVVDFLNVGIGPVRTGIFNVADMAILLGLAFLLTRTRTKPGVDHALSCADIAMGTWVRR